MENTVEIIYRKQTNELNIRYGDKIFDTSLIKDIPLEQWVFPFYAKGTRWRGLYEELKLFTGNDTFVLHFNSDKDSFVTVKHALNDTPVKLVGANNIVTIIYHENPITTKIVINGNVLDTNSIENRYIDEWIAPIQIRGIQWNGVFNEIERLLGTDIYTLYFVGEQKFMELLIDNCPETISIFYKDPQVANPVHNSKMSASAASKITLDNISNVAGKALKTIKENSEESAENNANTNNLPIKNTFIRNNIMTLCAICSILLLFLPFASFSATASIENAEMTSRESSISGFEAIFGIKDIKIGANSSIFALFLLIIPILIIAINYIRISKLPQKWIAVAAPALGIIVEIITLLDIRKLYKTFITTEGVTLKTSLGIGFILIFIVYLVTIIIASVIYHNMKLPKKKNRL